MENPTFFILGGYGNTGIRMAKLLLQETGVRVVLGGRSLEKAIGAAEKLNQACSGNRVSGAAVDASDPQTLKQAFSGMDFIIVASGTSQYAREVATAALEAGADYLDFQISAEKLDYLQSMDPEIARRGRCFITEAGFHPGLPAALVRYAAIQFDTLESATVSSVINLKGNLPVSESTFEEFVGEFKSYKAWIFREGRWVEDATSMKDMLKVDFGSGIGRWICAPMYLEELHSLPEQIPTLKKTGFFISDTNQVVNYLIFPLLMVGLKFWPEKGVKPLSKLLYWSYRIFPSKKMGVALKVEAKGLKDGKPKEFEMLLYHDDGYTFTALAAMACLLQYLDGSIQKPGLLLMGNAVESERLIRDINRMGAQIQFTERFGSISVESVPDKPLQESKEPAGIR